MVEFDPTHYIGGKKTRLRHGQKASPGMSEEVMLVCNVGGFKS